MQPVPDLQRDRDVHQQRAVGRRALPAQGAALPTHLYQPFMCCVKPLKTFAASVQGAILCPLAQKLD